MAHNYSVDDLTRRWTTAQPLVFGFISSQVQDFHDAQDILQEVAAALVQSFGRYDSKEPFLPWVIAIARHKVQDFYRRTSVDRIVFDDDALDAVAAAYEKLEPESSSILEAMEHCLKRVGGRSKTILNFRYQDAMTSADIAERLRIKVHAVDVTLHRIRAAVRDCIQARMSQLKGIG